MEITRRNISRVLWSVSCFSFFADDAGIFPKRDIFRDYMLYLTKENGEDLGGHYIKFSRF